MPDNISEESEQLESRSDHLDTEPLLEETETAQLSRHTRFVSILQQILPQIGKESEKIIHAQVMLALKLEGLIGKDLTQSDEQLIEVIKESILESEQKTEEALLMAKRVLKDKS